MRRAFLTMLFVPALSMSPGMACAQEVQKSSNPDAPEIDLCRASGLITLKETAPSTKDVAIDPDSVRIFKMDKKIGGEAVRSVMLGEVSIEKSKSAKPRTLICIVGDKGKVLVTEFSAQ